MASAPNEISHPLPKVSPKGPQPPVRGCCEPMPLKRRDTCAQLFPGLLLGTHHDHHDVRTRRERPGVMVSDHKRIKIGLSSLNGFCEHSCDVCIDRVHLRLKLDTSDTITDVPHTGAVILHHQGRRGDRLRQIDPAR